MSATPTIQTALGGFPDYELIDSGRRCKLERFGAVTVIRGEPKAWWEPALPPDQWDRAQAVHDEDQGWDLRPGCPREWNLRFENLNFIARISDTSKHLGVFPEQAPHWRAIQEAAAPGARLLNLFGYTGVGSQALAAAGASVTHVDASKKSVALARDNAALAGMAEKPIRWIVDDAGKFTAREVRRERRYDAILLDPPKFGRGPGGERWQLEEGLAPLLGDCRQLLDADSRALFLTVYAVRMSALAIGELLAQLFADLPGTVECGELAVREEARGLLLPTAIFARWSN